MKAKGPAAAKAEEEKKKGLALFGTKPPTPKLLRALGGGFNKKIMEKLKVRSFNSLFKFYLVIVTVFLLIQIFVFFCF